MSDMNQKYQQYYNEYVSSTFSELLTKNVSFQANIKLANEIIEEQDKKLLELKELLEKERAAKASSDIENKEKLNLLLLDKDEANKKLKEEIAELNVKLTDYDKAKFMAQHVETFKNEIQNTRQILENEREEHKKTVDELIEKIKFLELSPAKRKKLTDSKEEFVVDEPEPVPAPVIGKVRAKIIKQELPQTVEIGRAHV